MQYETRGLLCGAYLRSDDRRSYLTHTVPVVRDAKGYFNRDAPTLCKRVNPDNVFDGYANDDPELNAPPTCPTCLRRDPRFRRAATQERSQ